MCLQTGPSRPSSTAPWEYRRGSNTPAYQGLGDRFDPAIGVRRRSFVEGNPSSLCSASAVRVHEIGHNGAVRCGSEEDKVRPNDVVLLAHEVAMPSDDCPDCCGCGAEAFTWTIPSDAWSRLDKPSAQNGRTTFPPSQMPLVDSQAQRTAQRNRGSAG